METENILFDIWVSDKMIFSDEDKRECFEVVKIIVNFANVVRKEGLLSLEDKIESMPNIDIFLKNAINMAIDALEERNLRKILHNYIISGNFRGKELLKRILITDGVSAIMRGCNPKYIEIELLSHLGENYSAEYENFVNGKKIIKSLEEMMDDVLKDKTYPKDANLLEDIFEKMDDFAIQRLMRDIDVKDILPSMYGSSERVVRRILCNVSRKSAELLINDYVYLRSVRFRDILQAQNRILDKIKVLEECGEIVSPNIEG